MPPPKPDADREPLPFSGRWLWHNQDHPLAAGDDCPDHLPADVFGRLDGFLPGRTERTLQLVKAYRTAADAKAALARARAAFGREFGGGK